MLQTCLFLLALHAADAKPAARIDESKGVLRVTGAAKGAAKGAAVYVDRGTKADQLAMLGKWAEDKESLVFTPRYPFVKGVRYRVVVGGAEFAVSLPKPEAKATTRVTQVYPTADKLPENQLKFYLHFSAPMSQSGSYQHISLLDAKGKKIDLPFLELDQELWDPTGTRFTLFFDPGRIKRGLKPREEVGPSIEEGKSYTLVLDAAWADAEGNPLKERFTKKFSVGAPDDAQPSVKTWKLKAPASGGREALRVAFPKSMDHALSSRLVWVVDAKGKTLAGKVELSDRETAWSFTPELAWASGRYHLVADTRLEDLAGNSLGRPFEIDMLRPVEREIKTETVKVPFEVK